MDEFLKKIELSFLGKFLLYTIFFVLAFNKVFFYLPLFISYLLILIFQKGVYNPLKENSNATFFCLLMGFFIFFTFLIGYDRMTLTNPLRSFVIIIFALWGGGYILLGKSIRFQLKLFACYLLGIFVESFLICLYSFFIDPIASGYGSLIHPFGGYHLNSPSVGNLLAIVFVFFYYFLIFSKNLKIRLPACFIVFLCAACGIFLAGRTFFIIVILTIIFFLLINFSIKTLLKIIFSIGFTCSLIYIVFIFNDGLTHYISFIKNRFENGLSSTRFDHYIYGIKSIPYYPFGGFEVDQSIEATRWLHNFLLDSARVAGWLPLIVFMSGLTYLAKKSYMKLFKLDSILPIWIVFITFLLMSQDVVLENNYRMFIIFNFISIILITDRHYIEDEFFPGKNS